MKILFATFWDYPHVGGVSTHIRTLKSGLEELGHQVFVFSKTTATLMKTSNPSFFTSEFNPSTYFYKTTEFIHRYNLLRFLFEQVAAEINFDQFDLIHSHDVVATEVVSRLTKKPIITTVHGYLANECLSEKAILKGSIEEAYLLDIEKKGSEKSDYILSVDQKIYHYEKDLFHLKQPMSVMKNFVDFSLLNQNTDKEEMKKKLGLPSDCFLLISPRRLVEKNGVLYGVKILHELIKKIPNALLICFGDGPQRPLIEAYILENSLSKHCILAGNASNEVVAQYLNAADVTLIPSIPSEGVEEATSIAAIEGMAKQTVVLASNIGGLKELLIHGKTGMLVEPFNTINSANLLSSLYSDKKLREEIQMNAYTYSREHYSHLTAADAVSNIYRDILSLKNKG